VLDGKIDAFPYDRLYNPVRRVGMLRWLRTRVSRLLHFKAGPS
jgi:hypothetical protein